MPKVDQKVAAVAMKRLKDRKGRVVVSASPRDTTFDAKVVRTCSMAWIDKPGAVQSALQEVATQFPNVTKDACAIVHDTRGRPLQGSVVVVVAVATEVEVDSALL